jgi:Tol biopolymer transport system component
MRWHPFEDKVAMFDIGGLLIFDLTTDALQPFDLNDNDIEVEYTERFTGGPFWATNGEWSPNGQSIALKLVLGMPNPFFKQSWLVTLTPTSREVTDIALPFAVLLDLAWAPNSRQLLVIGKERISDKEWDANIFLVDVSTNEVRLLEQFSTSALGGYGGYTLAWSPDGHKLVYRCRPGDMPTDAFALCEANVMMGEVQ